MLKARRKPAQRVLGVGGFSPYQRTEERSQRPFLADLGLFERPNEAATDFPALLRQGTSQGPKSTFRIWVDAPLTPTAPISCQHPWVILKEDHPGTATRRGFLLYRLHGFAARLNARDQV
jgi:hypothetical protein